MPATRHTYMILAAIAAFWITLSPLNLSIDQRPNPGTQTDRRVAAAVVAPTKRVHRMSRTLLQLRRIILALETVRS